MWMIKRKKEKNKRFILFFIFGVGLAMLQRLVVFVLFLAFVTGDVRFMANCNDSTSKAFL